MRKRCTRTVSLLSVIVFIGLSSSKAAQIPVAYGRLISPARESTQGLVVILEGNSSHTETYRAEVRGDGGFEFRDILAGDYALRVTNGFGLTVCQQFVTIHDHMPQLEVRLPERESNGAGEGAATVSVKQLMHPPHKKAVQAFQCALRLSEAGKYEDAASELEKAIRISPEFAEAHTNLAVQYFRMGRLQESMAESARAIQIGGPDPRNLCNLATAQAQLNRRAEAEQLARAALRLDSSYLKASLILGSILVDQPATRREGIKHLEKAATEFAFVRQYIEQLRASR
jgi:predicted Zn-dependent protease